MRKLLLLLFLLVVFVPYFMETGEAYTCLKIASGSFCRVIHINAPDKITPSAPFETGVSIAPGVKIDILGVVGCLGEDFVSKVEYYIDGELVKVETPNVTIHTYIIYPYYNPYTSSFPEKTLGIGKHVYKVKAYLSTGVYVKTKTVEVVPKTDNPRYVSAGPASITLYTPLHGQRITLYNNQTIGLYGIGHVSNYYVCIHATMSAKLDGNPIGSATIEYKTPGIRGWQDPVFLNLPSNISEGRHRLDITLQCGQVSGSTSIEFEVIRGNNVENTVMIEDPGIFVGAPGNWCSKVNNNTHWCGKADPVAYKVGPPTTVVHLTDPIVKPPDRSRIKPVTTYVGPPVQCDPTTYNFYCVYPCTDCIMIYNPDMAFSMTVKPLNASEYYLSYDGPVFKYYYTENITMEFVVSTSASSYTFYVYSKDTGELFGSGSGFSGTKNFTITLKPATKYGIDIEYRWSTNNPRFASTEFSATVSYFERPVYVPQEIEIHAIEYGGVIEGGYVPSAKRFIVLNGDSVDLSFNTSYCKYLSPFPRGMTVDDCCHPYDEKHPVRIDYFNPDDPQDQRLVRFYYYDSPPTPPPEIIQDIYCAGSYTYVDSRPVRALFAASHPSSPDAYTAIVVNMSGLAYPPTGFITDPLTFKLPIGDIPLNQMIVPVAVQRHSNNYPALYVRVRDFFVCGPTNIKINGIPYTLSLIMYDWKKAYLINPLTNRPGVAEEREHLVEYLTVDTLRTYHSYYVAIPLKRGEAYLEGSTLDMVFNITTSTPIVNATFWNASNPNLKVSCNRNGPVDTIVRKDALGNNVTITCEITDPMGNITIKNWVALNTGELWYLRTCNEEGLCNQTYVNILGAKAVDVSAPSAPPPTPGSLSVKITYPEYGATVSPGQLTARATASVSGGYGMIREVEFSFGKWDSSLGWVTQCSVTRTSPDSGDTYSAQCDVTEGKWKLTVFAKDSNKNLAADSVEFNVKQGGNGGGGGNDGPSGTAITEFRYPVQCVVDGSNVTITFSAYSPNGLKSAKLYADGVLVAEKGLSGPNANNVQMTFKANFNGKQYIMLRLVVTDNVGLSHETTGMIVPCELCPDEKPTVRFIKPSSGDVYKIPPGQSEIEIPITIEFSDDSAVKKVELYIDNTRYFEIDLNAKSGTLDISPNIVSIRLSEGNYTLTAVAIDSCGQKVRHDINIRVKAEDKPVNESGGLVWVYYNTYDATNSLVARNGSLLACMVNTNNVYSVGQLRYTEVPSVHLEGFLTTSQYVGRCPLPTGDGQKVVGSYDRDNKLVYLEWPCGVNVKWQIDPNKDYKLDFKQSCCRYECPTNRDGCVLVC